MCKQNELLIVFLAIINIAWLSAYLYNRNSIKKKVDELRDTKKKAGLPIIEKDLKDEVEPNSWYTWVIGIAICLNVWIIGAIVTYAWADWFFVGDRDNIDNNKAIFGDSFGAVNALISAFAFGGMIVTFFFQRYELKLQRKELQDQRKEFEQQNQTLALQRFENTFFNMLQLQQEIVAGLEYTPNNLYKSINNLPKDTYKGREVFEQLFKVIKVGIETEGLDSYCHSKYISLLDHYFRHFYTIINFIDKSTDFEIFTSKSKKENNKKNLKEKKYQYAKILRATLSRYELVLLYYNGLSKYGKDKLKPLIEEYSMLNNINEGLLALSRDNYSENEIRIKYTTQCNIIKCPPTDYLFYITNSEADDSKYNISAFFHNEEEQNERKWI